jgi:hypothetical protein
VLEGIVVSATPAPLPCAWRTKKKRTAAVVIVRLRLAAGKAGRIVATLVPTAGAKAILARQGKLRATVTITYTPKGGEPRSIVRTVVFRLKRH